jgi:hypothetical protein
MQEEQGRAEFFALPIFAFFAAILILSFPYLERPRSQDRSRIPPTAMLLRPDPNRFDLSSRALSPG